MTEPIPGGGSNILNSPPSNCFLTPFKTPETETFIDFLEKSLVGTAPQPPFLSLINSPLLLDGLIELSATPGIDIEEGFLNPL